MSSVTIFPCEPCLQPGCDECALLFHEITTVEEFVASRDCNIPNIFANDSLASLKEHISFIYIWGTGAGPNFQKLKHFYDNLPHDSPGIYPRQSDLEIVFLEVASMVLMARHCHDQLGKVTNDAALSARLRGDAIRLLESWHIMHGYILWLIHLFQMGPEKPEVSMQLILDAIKFPRPPVLSL